MKRLTLRTQLLLGILLPVAALISVNTVSLYEQASRSADMAYDRTLLASAKLIGEFLSVAGSGPEARLEAAVPYSALEPFEADKRSRMYYKVSGFSHELVSGFPELRTWQGKLPDGGPYSALVHFYDDSFRGERVRVAVLLQPVATPTALGMATIQVAETMELREALARQILISTLWRQLALVVVIAVVVVIVVQRATRPVRQLSADIARRTENDLTPIGAEGTPRELRPLLDATNQVMQRLKHLLDHQKRFVRDTSHQLRTPLAVLKVQVQSALRGDVGPDQALQEINQTVDRATVLANQMLALAKVEQLRLQDPNDAPLADWAEIVRAVALDLSALIGERHLDFDIATQPSPVRSHEWALRELTRNLLHNAIKHTPDHGRLSVRLHSDGRHAALVISDSGPGITEEQRERLFTPFAAGDLRSGVGLGLAICREIVDALGGSITLDNRRAPGRVLGLDATVRLGLHHHTDEA
ncbi:sensor histidine kinase [Piscinibacter sp. HJYY11]|uniref:sensor histidine kinase n=1 Tax=Piscinibacter sp. HJYY11 TaxID=2801333 RepID=UPI002873BC39|nr:sensor histidine kinase [Piscinibacter sp. HJYY11]